ncbi:oxygen-independent coproporphyrinogen III oxidase [Mesorhizobium sp. CGMCC 1.15528]|uniref:Coproporphyrinogen-III oxidase n=1 Tax=Mesorhizobium zhangyense TaxID=1776730 RepID=A0A7C9VDP2_9HYPH|nr:oxygen-independent coproporphyrinogen III oxidase [Mesorhizobium zhangyense]NGN42712.1 oxygen-independent coproporphyrinogen III oxidase [Mesorhizobium zhangyense]
MTNTHRRQEDYDLLTLATRTIPRYTSYPTAPQFTADVDAAIYGSWLDMEADRDAPVSIYLHVPFCRSICNYCGCTTKAALRDDPVRAYAEVLKDEIRLVGARTGRVAVSHLHWGGGTPNILPPDCMAELVGLLSETFRFRDDMEHAIELDPRHVTVDGMACLAGLGVNRVSLGVQTLDDRVQKAIARVQPLAIVEDAMRAISQAGIADVNFDLMFGLPFQTEASIKATVEQAVRLAPSRFAVFGYAHVPWMKPHQRLIADETLPDAGARIAQARLARRLLVTAGYHGVGIDHFARGSDPLVAAMRNGTMRRNFQGYTTDTASTLIGLGASSISRTPSGYAQNLPDNAGWQRRIRAGELPVARGKAIDAVDRMRGDIIESILCFFEADLAVIAKRHGIPVDLFGPDIVRLRTEMGTRVRIDDWRTGIERDPHETARLVASHFDGYLHSNGRYSVAV